MEHDTYLPEELKSQLKMAEVVIAFDINDPKKTEVLFGLEILEEHARKKKTFNGFVAQFPLDLSPENRSEKYKIAELIHKVKGVKYPIPGQVNSALENAEVINSDPGQMVRTFDFVTKEIRRIPFRELADGMVAGYVEGVGECFVDPSQAKRPPLRHPKFEGEQLSRIKAILETFNGAYDKSLDEFEDRFRRDMNPDKEIGVWEEIAKALSTGRRRFLRTSSVK